MSKEEINKMLLRRDPSSFSNHDIVSIVNYDMDMKVDFTTKTINTKIIYTIKCIIDNPSIISLDMRDQTIKKVQYNDTDIKYEITEKDHPLGQALLIYQNNDINKNLHINDTFTIEIHCITNPSATAIQWLEPQQTRGKKYPYLFTQCQAIHCRSWIPCQDTPGNKATYKANITVNKPLRVLMSAIEIKELRRNENDNEITYVYQQNIPISTYLIAMCVGVIKEKVISERCSIWTEEEDIDRCSKEFEDIEMMIETAERINGPYIWGKYDQQILPPSFPYGGMENPNLTFVTPSLIAGDKSLVNVVLHEQQHSWTGNLVTNDTWEGEFLNEGFTIYGERKLVKEIYGEKEYLIQSTIGWQNLCESIELLGSDNDFTRLVMKLNKDTDPDDAFSTVPYEKGYMFLIYLEKIVGEMNMRVFLQRYYDTFKYKTITAENFKKYFIDYFVNMQLQDKDTLINIDWDKLFYTPGLPDNILGTDELSEKSIILAKNILKGTLNNDDINKYKDIIATWSTAQHVVFQNTLVEILSINTKEIELRQDALIKSKNIYEQINSLYPYRESHNMEILNQYLQCCIRLGISGLDTIQYNVLSSIGRMKFIRPLYRDLFSSSQYREFGLKTFESLSNIYHNICSKMVDRDRISLLKKDPVY